MPPSKLIQLTIATLMASLSITAHSIPPKVNVGGFYPGMTKVDAKKLGYDNCDYGDKSGPKKESIFCTLPLTRVQLGNLKIASAKLEFKAPNNDRVSNVQVTVSNKPTEIVEALTPQYGNVRRSGHYLIWQLESGHTISFYNRFPNSTYTLTFAHDPDLEKLLKKRSAEDKKRAEKLQTF